MPAPRKYPNELRERAVRLVAEAREQEPELSLNAAVNRIGPRVGVNAAFIDAHRDRFGVEPICRVLSEHDWKIAPSTF